ncbi:DUF421 domain-containing protein [Candidatus Contubernalis alkaliaceticus]|uniref:DUF421 domain-containing protein n=1 Tax=Candidatus Contubernalis alkaliaceticus TaxID=338645 RepID=UPI001F4BEB7C|nr:DUF421 domain-containing protein [Candidatus Contubernalis alkalaceticus]UNC91799.1 DUF421 domain-containing protein [Candidatus Contubernalis alkalaceticus]
MDFLNIFFRVVTVLIVFQIVILIMGKRQIGQLQVFDFIIAITIGSVAGADIADPSVEHLPTVFAIIVLGAFQWLFSKAVIKYRSFGHFTTFEPTIVIQNGKILNKRLKEIRFSLDTLLELLRGKGVFRVNEVEFALIEANGTLSVLRKSQYESVQPSDLQISTDYNGLSTPLIVEGRIHLNSLKQLNLNENWLRKELSKLGINCEKEVFYGEIDSQGQLHISPYQSSVVNQDLRL